MPWMTSEQIAAAKTVDLLTYLQTAEPWELKKTAPNEYRTVSHGSLVISHGKWIWNKERVGGRSALEYLIKVRGMDFTAAVETVLSCRAAPVLSSLPVESPEPPQEKILRLPKRTGIPSNAVRYLQRRGIHSDIISHCLQTGIFYESIYKNPKDSKHDGSAVCVFVGRDDDGVERFAALRGIGTDLKRDVGGSDKRFGFVFPAHNPGSRALAVFESPVDALSHATLSRRGVLDFDGHRLSLGGTADVALMAYLERNPQIERISLCLDNDKGGQTAAERIFEMLGADERYRNMPMTFEPPENGKDYNEALLHTIKQEREQKKDSRIHEAVLSL